MPVSICPRCKHFNPDYASYCYFDGSALHANQSAVVHRLPNDFVFSSGRRCKTFDELAQGCQEEWTAARDMLQRGLFAQFFQTAGRADLVRAANDARAQVNPDIALTTFLSALPGTRTATPKLDLHPRRILLGNVVVGETKTLTITITNQGQGMLQGTVTVTDGQDWLSLGETGQVHQVAVNAVRDQTVKLCIRTRGIAAGQIYGAKLTVVTNGGVGEIPLRMDLVAQPYSKPPYPGVRTQRELAEKVRANPKIAVPILESGDFQRWFALNGWTYPVSGTPIKGVGGVQQFFEALGLSKPPTVSLSQSEFRLACKYRESLRAQATLQTKNRKWVYAQVSSDSPWLKVLNPQISGPQHATVPLEIDTHLWDLGPAGEGTVNFLANGGQRLALKVMVEVQGAPAAQRSKPTHPAPASTSARGPGADRNPFEAMIDGTPPPVSPPARGGDLPGAGAPAAAPVRSKGVNLLPALATMILLCFVLRIVLVPFIDWTGRSNVVIAVATEMNLEPTADSPVRHIGGWLELPWLSILGGGDAKVSSKIFQPGTNKEINAQEFRHYFASYFIRWFVLWAWWVGSALGVVAILRRGGSSLDVVWAVIAGAGAGLALSATLAAFVLVGDMVPHMLWYVMIGGHGGAGYLMLWSFLAVISWIFVGFLLGLVLPWIGPIRRVLIDPLENLIAQGFRLLGLKKLGDAGAAT